MEISIVVAVSDNNAIGAGGALLWHLPKDMQYFKEVTTGHHVLMGRKTWESIPAKFRPLTNRVNIIVTRQKDFKAEGAIVVRSLDEGIEIAKKAGEQELMVIGGGEIYKQVFPKANKVYLTKVHATFVDADAFAPDILNEDWKVASTETHWADEKHKYHFDFVVLEKI
jgi:dihydrofolate reductase